jgi:hypothetical protein
VALFGNDVLVGAYLTNSGNGAAYLYNTSGTLLQTFNHPGNPGNDEFGYSVALSGNDVLVGADTGNGGQGAAYLYNTSGTLLHSFNDPGNNLFFGYSVALSGNDVLVGDLSAESGKGAGYLYNITGALLQTFNDPGHTDGDAFGNSVALSGNDVLVGAFGTNDGKGAAYLYNTAGTLLQTFNDPRNAANDGFGGSVALSGNDLLVGAYSQTSKYDGAAYLYAGETGEISALLGNNQSTTVGIAFGTLLEAQVTDASGNPLPDCAVTFTINNGSNGASATFGSSTVVTVTTNSEGLAIAPVLTADTVAGSFSVTASVNGASTTFLLTNISGAPAKIVVAGGNGQSAPVDSAYATLLQVQVTDSYGNPVAAVPVTFSAPSSGPSGTFNAITTVPTNALGIATAPAFAANDNAGTLIVTASAPGIAASAQFDLTNIGASAPPDFSLAHTFQPPNSANQGYFGGSVVLSGSYVLIGASPVNNNDFLGTAYLYNTSGQLLHTFVDPNGPRHFGIGLRVAMSGDYVLMAVDGGENGPPGIAYLFNTSGQLLQTIQNPDPTAGADFGSSIAISGNSILISDIGVNVNRGAVYLYNTSGQLLQTFHDPGGVSGDELGYSLAFSGNNVLLGTITGGTAYLFNTGGQLLQAFKDPNPTSGDRFGNSIASAGTDVLIGADGADSYNGVAYLFDASGALLQTFHDPSSGSEDVFGSGLALSGTNVLIGSEGAQDGAGGAYLFNTSGQLLETFPDPDGVHTSSTGGGDRFGGWVALSGSNVLIGAIGVNSYAGAAYLYDLVGAQGVPQLSALFGNNESTIVGTAFGTLLEAQVTDASGNPLPGYSVTFTVNNASNSAGATFGGSTVVTVATNSEGLAIAPVLMADTVAGSFTVTASVNGASTTFLLTNTSGAPAKIAVAGGNGQSAPVNSAYGTLLQVEVTDAYGNPVAGVAATFSTPQSGPSGTFNAVSTVPTNALGIATAPRFTANDIAGTFEVTATVAGVSLPATFTLTNTKTAKRTWTAVVGKQLTELYREFRPYHTAGQAASFVPSNDLEALNVANGQVAIAVRAFVDTSTEIMKLGGQVTGVHYLPVAFGMPGIEVDAVFPIIKLPDLGKLADVVVVSPQFRTGPSGSIAPSVTLNPHDRTVTAGTQVTFTAAASGVVTPTVQWQVSGDDGKIFINIPGAISTALTFTATTKQSGDEYRAVFSNALGQISTTAATLTVRNGTDSNGLSGEVSGVNVLPPPLAYAGWSYFLSGSGSLGGWGSFQVYGELTAPGFGERVFTATARVRFQHQEGNGNIRRAVRAGCCDDCPADPGGCAL